jgi:hypothetical protein
LDWREGKAGGRLGKPECSRITTEWHGAETHNQLSQKDLLVRVEGVDDQVHQLADLGLEAV